MARPEQGEGEGRGGPSGARAAGGAGQRGNPYDRKPDLPDPETHPQPDPVRPAGDGENLPGEQNRRGADPGTAAGQIDPGRERSGDYTLSVNVDQNNEQKVLELFHFICERIREVESANSGGLLQ